jgi:uncharacterized protein YjbI with pentapeptide repeats
MSSSVEATASEEASSLVLPGQTVVSVIEPTPRKSWELPAIEDATAAAASGLEHAAAAPSAASAAICEAADKYNVPSNLQQAAAAADEGESASLSREDIFTLKYREDEDTWGGECDGTDDDGNDIILRHAKCKIDEATAALSRVKATMNPEKQLVLKGLQLQNEDAIIDLSGLDLRGADFSGTNLVRFKFLGCDLRKANMQETVLSGVNLQ